MSDELHRLQVEEEMMMRKLHELISAHNLSKKKGLNDNAEKRQNDQEGAPVDMTNGADERQNDLEGDMTKDFFLLSNLINRAILQHPVLHLTQGMFGQPFTPRTFVVEGWCVCDRMEFELLS
ncbi:uncharacterized protein LOC107015282 isoform X2 [Solanum pennellii]|nr:uncharacterized protein LOC107015282 isoform X2 [Solanum pennellii]